MTLDNGDYMGVQQALDLIEELHERVMPFAPASLRLLCRSTIERAAAFIANNPEDEASPPLLGIPHRHVT